MSGETTDKPTPIISGPSQSEGIARFAGRTTYEDLTAERRERLKVSVLDALACAINALGAPPIEACRAQVEEFGGGGGSCALIGGGRTNIVYAAFYNTALVRYVDYMDSYLGVGGLCHPSDNTAAVLAASEHADLTGKDFLIALAVAYQIDSRLTAAVPFMAEGLDLTTPLSFSLAAGVSRALGLDEAKTAAAVGICGDFIPLLVARTTPISQWKGLSSSQLALGCVHGVFLASHGVTGPRYVIEGTHGLAQVVGAPIEIDWDNEKLDCFDRLALKSYNTAVPGQSSIFCILELRKLTRLIRPKSTASRMLSFRTLMTSWGVGASGRRPTCTQRKMPITASPTSLPSRSSMATFSRRSSSPAESMRRTPRTCSRRSR